MGVGAPLVLHCAAAGRPPPVITWYQRQGDGTADDDVTRHAQSCEFCAGAGSDWVKVRGTTHQEELALGAAALHMAGPYRCSADNGVSPPLLKHINVIVQGLRPTDLFQSGRTDL